MQKIIEQSQKKNADSQKIFDKITMFLLPVSNMPQAKEFYVDQLDLKITKEIHQDEKRWWVSLEFPGGGSTMTLTTFHEAMTLGMMTLYLSTPNIQAAHTELATKAANPTEIADDLYGPGSGVKWFQVKDPDGNTWTIAQS